MIFHYWWLFVKSYAPSSTFFYFIIIMHASAGSSDHQTGNLLSPQEHGRPSTVSRNDFHANFAYRLFVQCQTNISNQLIRFHSLIYAEQTEKFHTRFDSGIIATTNFIQFWLIEKLAMKIICVGVVEDALTFYTKFVDSLINFDFIINLLWCDKCII